MVAPAATNHQHPLSRRNETKRRRRRKSSGGGIQRTPKSPTQRRPDLITVKTKPHQTTIRTCRGNNTRTTPPNRTQQPPPRAKNPPPELRHTPTFGRSRIQPSLNQTTRNGKNKYKKPDLKTKT
ncbi:hypothetical protein QL285_083892 [Trifolium repens]|nr:hypothetical protein QL285_083892 [Trifolium repens]